MSTTQTGNGAGFANDGGHRLRYRVAYSVVVFCFVVGNVPLQAQGTGILRGIVEVCENGEVQPVAGVIVRAIPHPVTPTALHVPWPSSVTTSSEGSFVLEPISAGVWVVNALLRSVGLDSIQRSWNPEMEAARSSSMSARVHVVVEARGTTDIRMALGTYGIDMSPSLVRLQVGQSVQLTAQVARCQVFEAEPPDRPISWSSDDDQVDISPVGLVTGAVAGVFAVHAYSEGMEGTAVISVTEAASEEVDRIVVQNNTPPGGIENETVVLIDANSEEHGGCINDLVRGPDELEFEHLLLKAEDCDPDSVSVLVQPDEIVVFSVDHRVVMDDGDGTGSIWTDAIGEVREVDISGGLRSVPVVLWIAQEEYAPDWSVEAVANEDLNYASQLYNKNRAGIHFDITETKRVWGSATDLAAIGLNSSGEVLGCSNSVLVGGGFVPGEINVYYVPTVKTLDVDDSGVFESRKGVQCRTAGDWNMIYVSISEHERNGTTLAHELGHAFGLDHVPNKKNIMYGWQGSVPRIELLLGQVFRVNFEKWSAMTRNQLVPLEFSRKCGCRLEDGPDGDPGCNEYVWWASLTTNDVCPALLTDWTSGMP